MTPFCHGRSRAMIFSLDSGQYGRHPGRHAPVEIARFEARGELFVNDALAEGVGQDGFQTITRLQKKFVILNENEQHRPIIPILLADTPGAEDPHAIVGDVRVRLQLRVNGDENLIGALALEIFERLVQLGRGGRGDHPGIVVEIDGGRGRDDFIRAQPEAKQQS